MKLQTKQTLQIFWQHSKRYKRAILIMAAGILGVAAGDLYLPFWYKALFDALAAGDPGLAPALLRIVLIIVSVGLWTWVFRRLGEFTNSFFESRVMSDLLNTCFVYLHGHSYGFFINNFTGSLVRKANRYARAFEDITDEVVYHIGPTLIRILAILIILYFRHWALAAGLLAWSVIFVGFNYWFSLYKLPYDTKRAATDTKVTSYLADTLTGNINLKLFGGKRREFKNYQKLTDELYRMRRLSWDLGAFSDGIQSILLILLEFIALFIAVRLWQRGIFTVGDFALIQAYLIQIFYRVWDIGRFIRRSYESLADANEMTEILTAPYQVQDRPNAGVLKVNAGTIEFKNMRFSYSAAGQEVFNGFNLTIASGERVALIGPSGGGKSTVVKLLLRFYDIQGGQILIDGQNIAEVTQSSLRAGVALVPQEPILFHRSLLENIRYAKPDAGEREVTQASKLAHAHEFISGFPEGYNTFVGERGVKLSGGERQRVAIARAILKNAPILVLDEATSSLDSESEYYIQDALKTLMRERTTIVIAHRLSTIMQMDRIIVLAGGKITESGKHKELLKIKKGTYQKLWQIQAGGFANP